MKQIVLQIVSYFAVLASVAFRTGTAAAVNPITQKATLPPTLTPTGKQCDGVGCPSGRRCAVDENNKASCVCDGNCTDTSNKICVSDNRTYAGHCTLTLWVCGTSTNIKIISSGQCQDVGSTCAGVICPPNRECAVAANNRAICVCIQSCSNYPDPVCGSNNQTYMTECDLQRQSCLTNTNVTVAYTGECNRATVCDGFSCPKGMRCAINERHRPVCVCLDECPDTTDYDTVCGSDDRTYVNECELHKEACTSATSIRVAYKGLCLRGSVCDGHRCQVDRQCSVDESNRAVCGCLQSCSYDYNPVCGSDGITYQNLCDFRRLTCMAHVNVTVIRTGQCSYDEYCNGVVCPPLMTCSVDALNQTSCGCNDQCNEFYFPVCGSDNKTHINYCQLNVAACQTNTTITGLYYGVCSEGFNCEGIFCPEGTHCDSELQPEPTCVCDTVCPKTFLPLCGSNNKTYNNSCELQREACLTNTSISVQFSRTCEEGPLCDFTNCPYDRFCVVDKRNRPTCICSQSCNFFPTSEVCGTDNKTYSNECFLTVAACMTNKTIAVLSYQPCAEVNPCKGVVCSSDRYCDLDKKGRPICICNEQCDGLGSIVCGSDKNTYPNLCELQRQACFSKSNIHWVHYGRCAEATVCDGVSCPPGKRCAVNERNRPVCACIDRCLNVQYPICGNDGHTYYSADELQMEACTSNRSLTLVYRGQKEPGLTCSDINCPWDRICALNEKNQPTCVCNTDCSSSRFNYPVCGSDGKTYSSECNLQIQACTTNSNIQVDSAGPCNTGYTI